MMPGRLRNAFRGRPLDLRAWSAILAEEAHLRVGNRPPAVGKIKALVELAALLAQVESIGDEFCEVWATGEAIVVEANLRAVAAAGQEANNVPCAVVARAVGGLLRDVRFYLDPAPLPAAPATMPARGKSRIGHPRR